MRRNMKSNNNNNNNNNLSANGWRKCWRDRFVVAVVVVVIHKTLNSEFVGVKSPTAKKNRKYGKVERRKNERRKGRES